MQEPIAYTPVREQTETPSPWMEPQSLLWLNLVSFGFYFHVWFYRNWKHFATLWSHPRPLLRAVGLAVPLLDLWLIWDFVKRVRAEMATQQLPFVSPWPLVGVMLLLTANWLIPTEGLFYLLFVAVGLLVALWGGMCLIAMQRRLNLYWEARHVSSVSPGLHWFLGERCAVVLGAFIWLTTLIALVNELWFEPLKG
ncbi:MAG: hypothetical protein ACO1RX_02215 [Candidatus Sericytochromatia bacterium]